MGLCKSSTMQSIQPRGKYEPNPCSIHQANKHPHIGLCPSGKSLYKIYTEMIYISCRQPCLHFCNFKRKKGIFSPSQLSLSSRSEELDSKAKYNSPTLSMEDMFQNPSGCLESWITLNPLYTFFPLYICTYD